MMAKEKSPRRSQLVLIFFTVFIYLVGFGIVIPMIPVLARDFGANAIEVGLLLSVFSGMQFVFAPFWGRLSDQWGRRPILLICLAGEGLSYFLFAKANGLMGLFVARALAGFFSGSISTASAYISDITPPQERSKGMALIGAAFGLGFLIGPALGGGLSVWGQHISSEPHFGTSFASVWVAGFCLASFLFALKFLTESLNKANVSKERKGRLKQIFHYSVKPVLGPLIGVFFLSSLSMSTMEATLVLFVGDRFQWGIKEVSFGFAYIGLISVISQGVLVRRWLSVWGEKRMLITGLSMMLIAFLMIAGSYQIWFLAVAMTFLAFGTSFTNPSTLGSISLLSDPTEQGAVLGTAQGTSSLGRILGPVIGGFVYQRLGMGSPFVTAGIMIAVGLGTVYVLYSRLPNSAKKN